MAVFVGLLRCVERGEWGGGSVTSGSRHSVRLLVRGAVVQSDQLILKSETTDTQQPATLKCVIR